MEQASRIQILVTAVGIDADSFFRFVEWALAEQLVAVLADAIPKDARHLYFAAPDGLKQFRTLLRTKTKHKAWSDTDLNRLYEAVKRHTERHYRQPIEYGDYLKLLWQVEHRCAKCGSAPPDVVLHIDHVIPVALGGTSKRTNLQFLCSTCNLQKGKNLEGNEPWLQLM